MVAPEVKIVVTLFVAISDCVARYPMTRAHSSFIKDYSTFAHCDGFAV
jgi:hypothetical protein